VVVSAWNFLTRPTAHPRCARARLLTHGERGNLYYERGEDAEVVNQARAAIAKA
jgi:hypothetical protein